MALVRQFSICGPCLTLGRLVKETANFLVYDEWCGGDVFVGRKRISKGKVHTEPCQCCRDHVNTSYPHGYMD